ncbi:ankyrin repeat-containing protein BDA1-like [Rhododendron vialii]|uniref:ankyrin repeat-containing protein BDA1-like n=1 Tax=Rhododendron vialii TaxID=182163 RepID=UPI00265FB225|nr:ankyrin repeat-containing protein BDA1-like [Rhododendron vialii]
MLDVAPNLQYLQKENTMLRKRKVLAEKSGSTLPLTVDNGWLRNLGLLCLLLALSPSCANLFLESERMEELLCDAAMRGDLESLHKIIAKNNYILDKVLVGYFKGKNPLHLAISIGQVEFVQKLLEIKPQLAEVVDAELGAALHIASANGDLKIVEVLVKLSPGMCMARDRDGNNPLHIAAMKGKVDVLKKLVKTCPCAAQVIVDGRNTILHLCVNYNQLGSLKLLLEMIRDPEFVQSKDANGNTILHVAVFGKQFLIVKHVLDSTKINVNAINEAGRTALDIYFFVLNHLHMEMDQVNVRIGKSLYGAGAKFRLEMPVSNPSPSERKLMQTLMVVASLFATMAFQVGVNPPGGVWQDNSEAHLAGKAILAYEYPKSYSCFIYFNTVGFLLSSYLIISHLLSALPLRKDFLWWVEPVISFLTIMTTVFAYTYSITVVSPKHMMAVTKTILVSVIVWAFFMFVFVVCILTAQERARPKKAKKSILMMVIGEATNRLRLNSIAQRTF